MQYDGLPARIPDEDIIMRPRGSPKQLETRRVLATVTGMRHVALCLLIALNTFPDAAVQAPLVAFSALMVPPNTLLAAYTVIRSRKTARESQK